MATREARSYREPGDAQMCARPGMQLKVSVDGRAGASAYVESNINKSRRMTTGPRVKSGRPDSAPRLRL
jgi:hypothetical protein